MDWWARLTVQAPLLGENRPNPLAAAQPLHPVLPGTDAVGRQFIGGEPVPEGRVVALEVKSRIDQCASALSRSETGLAFHL